MLVCAGNGNKSGMVLLCLPYGGSFMFRVNMYHVHSSAAKISLWDPFKPYQDSSIRLTGSWISLLRTFKSEDRLQAPVGTSLLLEQRAAGAFWRMFHWIAWWHPENITSSSWPMSSSVPMTTHHLETEIPRCEVGIPLLPVPALSPAEPGGPAQCWRGVIQSSNKTSLSKWATVFDVSEQSWGINSKRNVWEQSWLGGRRSRVRSGSQRKS